MSDDGAGSEVRTRMVVVDDHRDSADVLQTLLNVLNFDVRAAYNATDALALVREFRPHCVLSDIEMPGVNGYQLAEMIRREEGQSHVILIALSGNCDPVLAEAAGFNYHLEKPVPPLTLTTLLQRILKMDSQLERTEKLLETQGEVVAEARDLVKEVKTKVDELKHDIEEVKQDVREIKDDLKDVNASQAERPAHPE